jgi:hypothetical protein
MAGCPLSGHWLLYKCLNYLFRQSLSGCTGMVLIYLWLYSPCGPWSLFQFLDLYTVGRTPWMGDQPIARPLPTHRINAQRHPCLESDSKPRSQHSRAKTVHALDRTATVIRKHGTYFILILLINWLKIIEIWGFRESRIGKHIQNI